MTAVRIGIIRLILPALLLLALAAPPAAAGDYPFEIGIEGGFVRLDENLAGPDGPAWEPTLGVRVGGPLFARHLAWYGDALLMDVQTETFRGEAQSVTARAGLAHPSTHPPAG